MDRASPLILFATTLLSQSAIAQPYNPQGIQLPRRACSDSRFFIEVPQWEAPLPSNFATRMTSELSLLLVNNRARWFCESPGSLSCYFDLYYNRPLPRVVPVLPPHGGHPARADGHLRFYRVFFETPHGDLKQPRPEAACEIIQHLRDQTSRIARGLGQPVCTPTSSGTCAQWPLDWVRIGRECTVTGLGLEAESLGTPLAEWPYERIELLPQPPPNPNVAPVTIALIDSGVRSDLHAGLDIAWELGLPTGLGRPPSYGFHPHGARVAALLRTIAPYSPIISLKVLDENGHGDIAALARAIDQATFGLQTAGPLILNLSVGFPPEMSRPSYLWSYATPSSGLCVTLEDGAGESVRYALDVAHRVDADGTQPITVVSAGGNRTIPVDEWSAFKTAPGLQHTSPCGTLASSGATPAGFFPAEYGHLLSCGPGRAPHTLLLPVSATDHLERPATNAMAGAEAFLVAPGEHVYAHHPSLPLDEVGMMCRSQVSRDEGFEFPAVMSGSSVSTAMVSAALARAQALAQDLGYGPMSSGQTTRLAYLSGEPLCRATRSGVPVRRLSVKRLEETLMFCPALVSCAGVALDPARDVTADTAFYCRNELSACGMEHKPTSCFKGSVNDVTWPDDYVARTLCAPGTLNCVPREGPECFEDGTVGVSLPRGTTPQGFFEESVVGDLGPQPDDASCPQCLMIVRSADAQLVLELNEYAETSPSVTFEDPHLVIMDGAGRLSYIRLSGYTDSREWAPGRTVIVNLPAAALGFAPHEFETNRAALDVGLRTSPKQVSRNVSPLQIKIQ